jgi:ABC-type glycerol-3-phosphate transport system permease component
VLRLGVDFGTVASLACAIPSGITAASVVVTVPLIVLVPLFQRRIISGLTAGAIR